MSSLTCPSRVCPVRHRQNSPVQDVDGHFGGDGGGGVALKGKIEIISFLRIFIIVFGKLLAWYTPACLCSILLTMRFDSVLPLESRSRTGWEEVSVPANWTI